MRTYKLISVPYIVTAIKDLSYSGVVNGKTTGDILVIHGDPMLAAKHEDGIIFFDNSKMFGFNGFDDKNHIFNIGQASMTWKKVIDDFNVNNKGVCQIIY